MPIDPKLVESLETGGSETQSQMVSAAGPVPRAHSRATSGWQEWAPYPGSLGAQGFLKESYPDCPLVSL